ncbi:ankyrin repeat protein [Streptomyces sp. SLBN-118]|uniref:ankyrin repeat domain-containing protein n=1 Tax=Streptomyces sp. SLBN-118 TaxID=2768454 RepID=UPI00116C6C44|nr:ankyrin repeat domain-containing protein [Streptomyces sp. SLBN-118]TQK52409.1 ankyrin repeat protein [Streptomyces sp. SLBN-118]
MTTALTDQLIRAIYERRTGRVEELLRTGASPSAASAVGETPVYLAAVSGEADIVRLLLDAGASPDEESRGPGSEGLPLCAAACWGYSAAVRELLSHGADPRLREDDGAGYTALLWAAAGGHHETARLLLEANADPDAGHLDRTPLMAAAEFGATGIVRDLLRHGADARRTDGQGHTALDLARAWCGKDIETELRKLAEARPNGTCEVSRSPRPDGTELIVLTSSDEASWDKGTGHAAIADLLAEYMPR